MVRPVGIGPIDNQVSFLRRDPPEGLTGIISVLAHAQEVELQRDATLPAKAAERPHLRLIEGRISAVIDQVRVGKIEKPACLQGLPALTAIRAQVVLPVPGHAVVGTPLFILIADIMLAQQEVFNRVGLDQPQISLP